MHFRRHCNTKLHGSGINRSTRWKHDDSVAAYYIHCGLTDAVYSTHDILGSGGYIYGRCRHRYELYNYVYCIPAYSHLQTYRGRKGTTSDNFRENHRGRNLSLRRRTIIYKITNK